MRLLLLRHGMTSANERRLYCGSTDEPLNDRGRQGLIELRKNALYPDCTGLKRLTSGMRRTDETLRLLLDAAPDARLAAFREMHFGRFEMHSYDELKNDPAYQAWIMDASGCTPTPDGESTAEFHARIFAAADALDQDAVLICHGGVIAALMQRWFPQEEKNMYQWQPSFGCGYEVLLDANGTRNYSKIPKIHP